MCEEKKAGDAESSGEDEHAMQLNQFLAGRASAAAASTQQQQPEAIAPMAAAAAVAVAPAAITPTAPINNNNNLAAGGGVDATPPTSESTSLLTASLQRYRTTPAPAAAFATPAPVLPIINNSDAAAAAAPPAPATAAAAAGITTPNNNNNNQQQQVGIIINLQQLLACCRRTHLTVGGRIEYFFVKEQGSFGTTTTFTSCTGFLHLADGRLIRFTASQAQIDALAPLLDGKNWGRAILLDNAQTKSVLQQQRQAASGNIGFREAREVGPLVAGDVPVSVAIVPGTTTWHLLPETLPSVRQLSRGMPFDNHASIRECLRFGKVLVCVLEDGRAVEAQRHNHFVATVATRWGTASLRVWSNAVDPRLRDHALAKNDWAVMYDLEWSRNALAVQSFTSFRKVTDPAVEPEAVVREIQAVNRALDQGMTMMLPMLAAAAAGGVAMPPQPGAAAAVAPPPLSAAAAAFLAC
jgi:hypothetical protein